MFGAGHQSLETQRASDSSHSSWMLLPEAKGQWSVTHRRDRLRFSVGEGCYFLKKQDVIPRGLPFGGVNGNIFWLMLMINFGCGLSFHMCVVSLN